MNPAPAHLEAKLRFGWDFTVAQVAAIVAGLLLGFAWANWLSPIHGIFAAVTAVYIGGLPVAAAFVASQTEFDLWAFVLSALRWRRSECRFIPGCGEVNGYFVLADGDGREDGGGELDVLDAEALWGAP